MDAAGHQIVPRTFGCGFHQHRGFDLDESVLIEIVPSDFGDAVAHQNIALQIGAAQVQIAVFQPQLFIDVAILHNFKGRGLCLIQNLDGIGKDLQSAGL